LPASESLLALTNTMTFIVVLLCGIRAESF
jgi:hypothetical protein